MTPAAARELARMAQSRGAGTSARQRVEALRLAAGSVGLLAPRTEPPPRLLRTGLPDLDAWLGGFPGGRVSEIVGPASAGKTSLALGALRLALDGKEGACPAALVDLTRSVVPTGAWARRLLVVRPRQVELGLRALDVLLASATFSLVVLEAPAHLPPLPEALRVRVARLCRESGTALVACGARPLFGSSSALRLDLAPTSGGDAQVHVIRNRQGPMGERRIPWRAIRGDQPVPPPSVGAAPRCLDLSAKASPTEVMTQRGTGPPPATRPCRVQALGEDIA